MRDSGFRQFPLCTPFANPMPREPNANIRFFSSSQKNSLCRFEDGMVHLRGGCFVIMIQVAERERSPMLQRRAYRTVLWLSMIAIAAVFWLGAAFTVQAGDEAWSGSFVKPGLEELKNADAATVSGHPGRRDRTRVFQPLLGRETPGNLRGCGVRRAAVYVC